MDGEDSGTHQKMAKTKIKKSKITSGLKKPLKKTLGATSDFVGLTLKLKGLSKSGEVLSGIGTGAESLGNIG